MSALAMTGPAVLREVRLYGPLRARFGRSHHLAVDSPAEAVHALCMMLDGFREAVLGHKGPGYRVLVGEGAATTARDEQTLGLAAGAARVIRIAPVLHGNKSGGASVILGVALLIAAPYAAGYLFSLGTAFGTSAAMFVATSGVTLAKAMILGGVIQLLSPQRKGSGTTSKAQTSYAFNGPVNVGAPGGPVPLIIGRMVVGSVVVSSGISTDEFTPVSTSQPGAPGRPNDEPADWTQFDQSP